MVLILIISLILIIGSLYTGFYQPLLFIKLASVFFAIKVIYNTVATYLYSESEDMLDAYDEVNKELTE